MSLVMLTNFTQTNGYIPATALTTIKKDDDKVNITASTEDVDVDEVITRVRSLVNLRDRIMSEGMSRSAATEFAEIAPEAVTRGFRPEMFTETPTRVNMSAGTESIISTAMTHLSALIKFLIDKLKKVSVWLVDAYQTLTGIKPTAYRLAQRTQYVEAMEKQIQLSLGDVVTDVVVKQLAEGMFNAPAATASIQGLFVDSTRLCDTLYKFSKPISDLQAIIVDVVYESAENSRVVAVASKNVSLSGDKINDVIIKASNNDRAYVRLQQALRNITKDLLASNIYKSPGKDKKAIIDDLSSTDIGKMLSGLTAAINNVEVYKPTPQDAVNLDLVSDKTLRDIIFDLANIDTPAMRTVNQFKDAMSSLQAKKQQDAYDMSVDEQLAKFLEKQATIMSAVDASRGMTADYAATVIKFTAVRNNIKNTAIVQLVQTSLEERALDAGNKTLELLQRAFNVYMTNMAK